ncbi:DUF4351 domain-containing protein [Roseofilum casamattae]|uniref:DUF4351 domain-containing protein n=1 Tax=Roseofilum casamattae BLCC-M143 TaxID=3022442 RepID=A0ABT7C3I3_9CYAN|nr:DUF4351 domain-containing protein [Roseofilum casamattae]MDJ1185138.1 DUF4351 domain-containing protein [Roseofilum casamattae BLCC-M143]
MSGLIHNPKTIEELFGEDLLEDSSFYQFILQKGRKQGIEQGREEGIQEGLERGRRQVILTMLQQKIGMLSLVLQQRIGQLSLAQLEALMAAMPNFEQQQDLLDWLDALAQ